MTWKTIKNYFVEIIPIASLSIVERGNIFIHSTQINKRCISLPVKATLINSFGVNLFLYRGQHDNHYTTESVLLDEMNPYCRLSYLEICSESLNHVLCHFQQSNIPRSSLGIDRWIRNSSDSNAFRSISQQEQHDDVISGAGTARLSDVHTGC